MRSVHLKHDVVHLINHNLQIIISNVELLMLRLKKKEEVEKLESIYSSADTINKIVQSNSFFGEDGIYAGEIVGCSEADNRAAE